MKELHGGNCAKTSHHPLRITGQRRHQDTSNLFKLNPFLRNSTRERRTDGHTLLQTCENASEHVTHLLISQRKTFINSVVTLNLTECCLSVLCLLSFLASKRPQFLCYCCWCWRSGVGRYSNRKNCCCCYCCCWRWSVGRRRCCGRRSRIDAEVWPHLRCPSSSAESEPNIAELGFVTVRPWQKKKKSNHLHKIVKLSQIVHQETV